MNTNFRNPRERLVLVFIDPRPAPTGHPGMTEYLKHKPVQGVPFQCTDEDIQLAGLTCSEDDPCPIYLELSAVAGAGASACGASGWAAGVAGLAGGGGGSAWDSAGSAPAPPRRTASPTR